MFGYFIFVLFCASAYGQSYPNNIYEANQFLNQTLEIIYDKLPTNDEGVISPQKRVFQQLLAFNYYFVSHNTYPNKDNIFTYLKSYDAAKKEVLKIVDLRRVNIAMDKVKEHLDDYYRVIIGRVNQMNDVCFISDLYWCSTMMNHYDRDQEKHCEGYIEKNAKLHKLGLTYANDILNMINKYVKAGDNYAGFSLERFLDEEILKNAPGLVGLSKLYNFLLLNDFTCKLMVEENKENEMSKKEK